MQIESVPGGALNGLLQQIGTELTVLPRLRELRRLAQTEVEQEIEEHMQMPPGGPDPPMTDEYS